MRLVFARPGPRFDSRFHVLRGVIFRRPGRYTVGLRTERETLAERHLGDYGGGGSLRLIIMRAGTPRVRYRLDRLLQAGRVDGLHQLGVYPLRQAITRTISAAGDNQRAPAAALELNRRWPPFRIPGIDSA